MSCRTRSHRSAYVDEHVRNCGIGGILLDHAEELAKGGGAERTCLETGITNRAHGLYKRTDNHMVVTKADPHDERLVGSWAAQGQGSAMRARVARAAPHGGCFDVRR